MIHPAGRLYLHGGKAAPGNGAGRDRGIKEPRRQPETDHRYLKLVNAMPDPLVLKINGLSLPEGAKAETFCGKPKDQQVELKSLSLSGSQLTLPPYSFTAIQVE